MGLSDVEPEDETSPTGLSWAANIFPPDLDLCSRLRGSRWLRCPAGRPRRAETFNFRGFPIKHGTIQPISSHKTQAGDGVTWIRKGTLGSIGGAGLPPTPTIQALLIARSRLARPLWTSWSKMVVA